MSPILSQRLYVLRIVYMFSLFQPFFLGFIAFSQGASLDPGADALVNDVQTMIFLGISIVLFIGGFFAKGVLLNASSVKRSLMTKMDHETLLSRRVQGRPVYSEKEIGEITSLSPKHLAMFKIQPSFFVAHVVCYSVFSSAALIGFVATFQTQSLLVYLPFMALTFIGLALNSPTRDRLEETLKLVSTSDWA